jgi:uncharacterized caspase-like protein
MRSALLFLLGFLLCLSAGPAMAEKRVALVIGMSKYQQVPRLTNPARDAAAMANLFRKAGFDVVDAKSDLGISGLRHAVRDFAEIARTADIAVVYYAGHGMEVNGTNYLIPVHARLASDFDIEDETISLDRVVRALDPVKRLKLVILDACRDNPFATTMKRSIASRSIGRGLAEVEPTTSDTLIAFAAKAGAVASDGDGQNSPFATALVKYIAEPGLDLRIAFGRVRDDVLKSTNNRQEPFVYGSLGGEITSLVPAVAKPVDPDAQARVDYELAAQIGTKAAWDSFLGRHTKGLYADLARAQTSKLMAAQQSQAKADLARRDAEEQAAKKTEELRKQLEEQAARQTLEAKHKLSEQAKKDLEEARRQMALQTQKELDAAKQQIEEAKKQAEAARLQVEAAKKQAAADAQRQVDEARKQAEAEAQKQLEAARQQALEQQQAFEKQQADRKASEEKTKLASLNPAPPVAPVTPAQAAPAPQMDPGDIARLLQAHLQRVGCNPGTIDGTWDADSRKALALFNKNAHTSFDVKVASLDALDGVRSKPDRVCPLVCAKGQRADGDRCVQISCNRGYFLNSEGACEKRAEPAPKPHTAHRETHRAPAPRRAGGGGKCFSFNGKTYCE